MSATGRCPPEPLALPVGAAGGTGAYALDEHIEVTPGIPCVPHGTPMRTAVSGLVLTRRLLDARDMVGRVEFV